MLFYFLFPQPGLSNTTSVSSPCEVGPTRIGNATAFSGLLRLGLDYMGKRTRQMADQLFIGLDEVDQLEFLLAKIKLLYFCVGKSISLGYFFLPSFHFFGVIPLY